MSGTWSSNGGSSRVVFLDLVRSGLRQCGRCGREVRKRGWGSHKRACDRRWRQWAGWVARGGAS